MALRVVSGSIAALALVLCIGVRSSDSGEPGKPAKEITVDLGDGVTMKLVLIPAGEFRMGLPDSEKDAVHDQKPQHRVRITGPFYLGVYEVTQEQYERVMGANPSDSKGAELPVGRVTRDDAQKFCRKLSELAEEKEPGRAYRLPTEAQWEYACRAGSTKRYCCGDDESLLGDYAWYKKNARGQPHTVGQKKPNAWGLYDMHGNAREWCRDWHEDDYYTRSPADDPAGPASGVAGVLRGGDWSGYPESCRSADRFRIVPDRAYDSFGLRVVQVPAE